MRVAPTTWGVLPPEARRARTRSACVVSRETRYDDISQSPFVNRNPAIVAADARIPHLSPLRSAPAFPLRANSSLVFADLSSFSSLRRPLHNAADVNKL